MVQFLSAIHRNQIETLFLLLASYSNYFEHCVMISVMRVNSESLKEYSNKFEKPFQTNLFGKIAPHFPMYIVQSNYRLKLRIFMNTVSENTDFKSLDFFFTLLKF